jgi:hypothetical protein
MEEVNMFKVGDVVRIKKEWLEEHEDPNTNYIVMEDNGDGRTKVWVESKVSSFKGYYHVWSSDVFYKVGHIEIKQN